MTEWLSRCRTRTIESSNHAHGLWLFRRLIHRDQIGYWKRDQDTSQKRNANRYCSWTLPSTPDCVAVPQPATAASAHAPTNCAVVGGFRGSKARGATAVPYIRKKGFQDTGYSAPRTRSATQARSGQLSHAAGLLIAEYPVSFPETWILHGFFYGVDDAVLRRYRGANLAKLRCRQDLKKLYLRLFRSTNVYDSNTSVV